MTFEDFIGNYIEMRTFDNASIFINPAHVEYVRIEPKKKNTGIVENEFIFGLADGTEYHTLKKSEFNEE